MASGAGEGTGAVVRGEEAAVLGSGSACRIAAISGPYVLDVASPWPIMIA